MKNYSIEEMRKDRGKIYDEVYRLIETFADKYPDTELTITGGVSKKSIESILGKLAEGDMIDLKVEIKIS